MSFLTDCRVLIVGAGALGCEILTKLAASGFRNLEIVDMDTIEVSNLSRQLLFRHDQVGQYKAEVAARAIKSIFPQVNSHFQSCRIETLPVSYFSNFHMIVCGVDNIESRLWLNGLVCSLPSVIPLIEGGTEGWMGHVRLVISGITACLYCTRYLHDDRPILPLCTLTGISTTAEQVVTWAVTLEWPKHHHSEFNPDDDEHIGLIWEMAKGRAAQFGITGVDKAFILETVRRIVPAIISTTALIAGICVLVTTKLACDTLTRDENYWFYNGQNGVYLQSHILERDPNCIICRKQST